MPRLTIGMPVFNGERFVEEAIDSLLSQTFSDFRLIIADNASTDGTGGICQAFASRDDRVSYFRQTHNLGAAENYNCLARTARTPFFKWAAADDIHAPTMIQKCIDALDANPGSIGAYTRTQQIDERGLPIKVETSRLSSDSREVHIRFRHVIAMPHSCFSIFGVYRTEILQATGLKPGYVGSDRALLAELALLGRSIEIREALVGRRIHPNAYSLASESGKAAAAGHWTASQDRQVDARKIYHGLVATCPALDELERRRCHREIETSYRLGRLLDLALKRTSTVRAHLAGLRRPQTGVGWVTTA